MRESEAQANSRADNESRVAATPSDDGLPRPFRCECGDRHCTGTIQLTLEEYDTVRALATRFAIARDHENPESEQVIEEHARFAVVETVSREATKVARLTYSRQWRRSDRLCEGHRRDS